MIAVRQLLSGDFTGQAVLVLQGVGKGDGFHVRLVWLS
jgi:hypothetical protein